MGVLPQNVSTAASLSSVFFLCGAGTALAQTVDGTWCAEDGTMFIDSQGIGFNEHTICEVDTLPDTMGQTAIWSSPVACHNVYISEFREDGNHEVHEIPVDGLTQLSLRGAADGILILSTDLHDDDTHFRRCN